MNSLRNINRYLESFLLMSNKTYKNVAVVVTSDTIDPQLFLQSCYDYNC